VSGWEAIARRESYFAELVAGRVHRWAGTEDVSLAMELDGISESWIFGFGFKDMGLCRLCNDYALESASNSGGRLVPLAIVPPDSPRAESEIIRCAERGAIGVGEIFPDGQGFDLCDTGATRRFAGICMECGLFVLVHIAEPVGPDYPGKGRTGPAEAYRFAADNPELRIVLAHWGGGLFFYENLKGGRRTLRNVWYDVAASPFVYGPEIFSSCESSAAADKVIYGSDFPILRYPRYEKMFSQAGMSPEYKNAITCANARRMLAAR
jgi:predicted TIM-barrel fold metal-dependent hydrolase